MKKSFHIKLESTLIEKIKRYAAAENRTASNLLETLAIAYVREKEREEKRK